MVALSAGSTCETEGHTTYGIRHLELGDFGSSLEECKMRYKPAPNSATPPP